MLVRIKGVNKVTMTLAGGKKKTYYYHRATGTKLDGQPGTPEFTASLDAAKSKAKKRTDGTLAGLIRDFEETVRWRKLAESTKVEYKRVFKFWDAEYGTLPQLALESKAFRQKVLKWHAEFASTKPREADNRVTILARVLSWGLKDGPLHANSLDGFERAYDGDRSEIIWLPEHVDAFMAKADHEMQLAMVLALHTGQRQADIRAMAWNNYDGQRITIRQGKSRRGNKPGTLVSIKCTKALKDTLDNLPKTGALILTTKTGRAFQKRYFARRWDETASEAEITGLNFHDLRGTAVTMLFEAGCSVAEVASITGHTMRRAQEILDKYLARTSKLAENAIIKLEQSDDGRLSRAALRKREALGGSIYFVRAGQKVKIGYSKDIAFRLSALQTANAEPLELIHKMDGTPELEKKLHAMFAAQRIGGEWFKLEGELALFLTPRPGTKADKA